MLKPQKEFQSHSIVVVGEHTPTIFIPSWFDKYELIRPEEVAVVERAKESKETSSESPIKVIHPKITNLQFDWVRIAVDRSRWIATTSQDDSYHEVRDLVIGVFQLLKDTPIQSFGINFQVHYVFESEEELLKFWQLVRPPSILTRGLTEVRTVDIVFQDIGKKDPNIGTTQFTVSFSDKYRNGIRFDINDHFQLAPIGEHVPGSQASNLLRKEWGDSVKSSSDYLETIISSI